MESNNNTERIRKFINDLNRKEGYYWVWIKSIPKFIYTEPNWIIAQWVREAWYLPGVEEPIAKIDDYTCGLYGEIDLEINEKQIVKEKDLDDVLVTKEVKTTMIPYECICGFKTTQLEIFQIHLDSMDNKQLHQSLLQNIQGFKHS